MGRRAGDVLPSARRKWFEKTMSVLAILLALALEQLRPMRRHSTVQMLLRAWADWIAESADAGTRWHALCVVGVAVVFPAAGVCAVEWLAWHYMGWLAWAVLLPVHVLVLYVTLGFRQFSRPFNMLKSALEEGDLEQAVQSMRQWRHQDGARDRQALIESAHRYALEDAHYCVFGVLLAYVAGVLLGLGAAGAVLYRLAAVAYARYRSAEAGAAGAEEGAAQVVRLHQASPALQRVSGALWNAVDYLPSRCTAAGFALLGNFEQAAAGWREVVRVQETRAQLPPEQHVQVVQAAGAGALGVRLELAVQGGTAPEQTATEAVRTRQRGRASQPHSGGYEEEQEEREEEQEAMHREQLVAAGAHSTAGAWGGTPDQLPESMPDYVAYGMAGSAWYQDDYDTVQADDGAVAAAGASAAPTRWVVGHLDSLVALLWRSLVFWLLALLLLQLFSWLV